MGKKVGIIGSGIVARTLGAGFLKYDHEVMLGTRDITKLTDWINGDGTGAQVGSFTEAAAFGEIVVLAVKGTVAKDALKLTGEEVLKGKIIIDAVNPIAEAPPVNGVLTFFSELNHSLMEDFQKDYPEANFVKAFSCVGSAFMVNPKFESKPTMFICGNSDEAKSDVASILDQFGWETADMGQVEAARAIEPLCMLWLIPGMRENQWNHAFKLLKL